MSIRIRSRFLRAAVFAVLASVLFALPQTLRAADLISGVEASLSGEPLQPAPPPAPNWRARASRAMMC